GPGSPPPYRSADVAPSANGSARGFRPGSDGNRRRDLREGRAAQRLGRCGEVARGPRDGMVLRLRGAGVLVAHASLAGFIRAAETSVDWREGGSLAWTTTAWGRACRSARTAIARTSTSRTVKVAGASCLRTSRRSSKDERTGLSARSAHCERRRSARGQRLPCLEERLETRHDERDPTEDAPHRRAVERHLIEGHGELAYLAERLDLPDLAVHWIGCDIGRPDVLLVEHEAPRPLRFHHDALDLQRAVALVNVR